MHICFGYAAIIHVRPEGYSFLPELANSPVQQVSIETAQSKLDCAVLEKLPGKTIMLGVLDLSDMTIETPETVAARIRRALPHVPAERIVVAPDCGLKYLPREVAFGKMRAMVEGAKIVRAEPKKKKKKKNFLVEAEVVGNLAPQVMRVHFEMQRLDCSDFCIGYARTSHAAGDEIQAGNDLE